MIMWRQHGWDHRRREDELEVTELIASNQSCHCHVNIHLRGALLNHLCVKCDPVITPTVRDENGSPQ